MRIAKIIAAVSLLGFACGNAQSQQIIGAAHSPCTLHIANNFGKPLAIILYPQTEKVFVDFYPLPQPIPLDVKTDIASRLDFSNFNEGYIEVVYEDQASALFSIDEECRIRGYFGYDLAFSWTAPTDNQVVTFCEPKYYQEYGTCTPGGKVASIA